MCNAQSSIAIIDGGAIRLGEVRTFPELKD
jgi:hypothetical protein